METEGAKFILNAAQKFVPDPELPTRDLNNVVTTDKGHAIRRYKGPYKLIVAGDKLQGVAIKKPD
jgi:hypothetical protein